MLPYPNIDPVFLKIGPLEFRWYGLMYVLGLTLGFWYLKNKLKTSLKLNNDLIWNLMSYITIGVILGGRLGYVLFYNLPYYWQHPLTIFAVWEGGMSFHGGGLGCVLAILIFSLVYKTNFYLVLDFLALGSTIGIGLGRLANFINGELYGRVTNLPWGMIFPNGGEHIRHPSQLYEAFFEGLVLFLILNFLLKKQILKPGQLFAWFLINYGIFRFFIEFLREPDSQIGLFFNFLSMGQLLSGLMIAGGGLFFFWRNKGH
jgi:phosphatidylglycerol---prolipoprotein diacylglyceryl transferase